MEIGGEIHYEVRVVREHRSHSSRFAWQERKGMAYCLYNVYTVVTTCHGITSLAQADIPQLGSYTMGEYEVLVYVVQATYIL